MQKQRETWGSKIGIILAVAGSAVGLGNFLRFPVQAVRNGGGVFMIPYIVSFLLLGLPLMWIEWTAGRYGGGFGHGSAPGIFHTMWSKNRFIKYFGVIGIFGPLVIFMYYTYIESWLLGYAVFTLTPKFASLQTAQQMREFLSWYRDSWYSYLFFILTFLANITIIYFGIKKGIEKFCNWAMPLLLVLAIFLVVRVLTFGTPDPALPQNNPVKGLEFLWQPDFRKLLDPKVWLAAAGQIFFTLSVGIGVILTYASYLRRSDDVILSGLTSAATNEFVEVVLGGSIVIPAAFTFLGPEKTVEVATSGAFDLGFVTMPVIFKQVPLGGIFAFMWFILLFLAGITSSVSLAQPSIAFLEDEFDIPKKDAVLIYSVITFLLCQPSIFLLKYGVVDELDFWGGTFCLVLFGCVESILFSWVYGIDTAWEEMHSGADIKLPKIYKFVIKYITPVVLIVILISYLITDGINIILLRNVDKEILPVVIFTRIYLLTIFVMLAVMVREAWRRRKLDFIQTLPKIM
ncbi:MAG: sodium-dependent transporter [Endomicrobia bacterium]|nr:sodium-dependent transporter [Endomicrobiia bacterium]